MRDRLEDMGRIYELLNELIDNKVFNHDYFFGIDKDNFSLRIDDMAIDLENLHYDLDKIWQIAAAQDYLNDIEPENDSLHLK